MFLFRMLGMLLDICKFLRYLEKYKNPCLFVRINNDYDFYVTHHKLLKYNRDRKIFSRDLKTECSYIIFKTLVHITLIYSYKET